jgi:hypothetical protein
MPNFYILLSFLIGAVYAIFFLYLYKSDYFTKSVYDQYPALYANGKLTKAGKLVNASVFVATLALIGILCLIAAQ